MTTQKATKPKDYKPQSTTYTEEIIELLRKYNAIKKYEDLTSLQLYIPIKYLNYFIKLFKKEHGVVNIIFKYETFTHFKLYVSKNSLKIFYNRLTAVTTYLIKKEVIRDADNNV